VIKEGTDYYTVLGLDLELEKSIGLGSDWPYLPIKKNHCVLFEEMKQYGYQIGDTISILSRA
jgi:hypothetical protein